MTETKWTKIATARRYGWNVRKEAHGWTVGQLTMHGYWYSARGYATKQRALTAAQIQHIAANL